MARSFFSLDISKSKRARACLIPKRLRSLHSAGELKGPSSERPSSAGDAVRRRPFIPAAAAASTFAERSSISPSLARPKLARERR
jgi:hypothetical protein